MKKLALIGLENTAKEKIRRLTHEIEDANIYLKENEKRMKQIQTSSETLRRNQKEAETQLKETREALAYLTKLEDI